MFSAFRKLPEQQKGIYALVFLAFVFATMGIYVRFLNLEFALFQQIYLRILGATLLGTALFWRNIEFRKFAVLSRKDLGILFFRSVSFVCGVIFFTLAFISTKYANATVATFVPLLPLIGFFFLKEKLSPRKLLYIALGFLGILIMSVSDVSHLLHWGRGEMYALASAVFFDFSYIARKWQSDHLNDMESVVSIYFLEGVAILILSFVLGEPPLRAESFSMFTCLILGVGALANVLNLFLVNYGFKRVEASVAGNILTLETVFALIIGLVIFSETPQIHELIGGALVIYAAFKMNALIAHSQKETPS